MPQLTKAVAGNSTAGWSLDAWLPWTLLEEEWVVVVVVWWGNSWFYFRVFFPPKFRNSFVTYPESPWGIIRLLCNSGDCCYRFVSPVDSQLCPGWRPSPDLATVICSHGWLIYHLGPWNLEPITQEMMLRSGKGAAFFSLRGDQTPGWREDGRKKDVGECMLRGHNTSPRYSGWDPGVLDPSLSFKMWSFSRACVLCILLFSKPFQIGYPIPFPSILQK